MSHEVLQVIKLVKYNRKSHEMIRVTCKCIPTTVNKEIHKNKHSHEMTQFRNRIVVWSSLHESVRIFGSSHGSVFESPLYRVHNRHNSESPVTKFGSHELVRNAVTRYQTHREEGESTQTHDTLTHVPNTRAYTYTCTPTYILYRSIHIYTQYTHTYTNIYIPTHTHTTSARPSTHYHIYIHALHFN